MKSALIDLFTSKKFLAALAAIVIYAGGRFGLAIDQAALDRIFAALLVYVGAQGVADVGKGAAEVRAASAAGTWTTSGSATPVRMPQSGRARLVVIGMLAAIGASIVLAAAGCANWRPRTAAGVMAFLSCESPHVDAAMLSDAKVLAIAAAGKWIDGSGTIDAAGLKADAAPLRSELFRCAFDAAIAALTAPVPAPPDGRPAAAEQTVDAAQVRATWASVRAELGWPAAATGAR